MLTCFSKTSLSSVLYHSYFFFFLHISISELPTVSSCYLSRSCLLCQSTHVFFVLVPCHVSLYPSVLCTCTSSVVSLVPTCLCTCSLSVVSLYPRVLCSCTLSVVKALSCCKRRGAPSSLHSPLPSNYNTTTLQQSHQPRPSRGFSRPRFISQLYG